MRLVSMAAVNPGDKLSYAIRTQNGQVLLPSDTMLTYNYIQRLKSFGILAIYIEDDIYDEVSASPCLADKTKTEALNAVEAAYKTVGSKELINMRQLKKAAKDVATDINKAASHEPVGLFNTYAVKDSRCLHAVDVATIVAVLAHEHGCEPVVAEDYVTAALLHDICLNDMSLDGDTGHAEKAKEYLKYTRDYSVRTYMSVGMHHERFDGKGPNKIEGEKIAEGARMIAVADAYDSLLHGYGSYKSLGVDYALEQINIFSGNQLDPTFLGYFNSSIAIYPVGSMVLLNNNFKAIVVAQNYKMPTRPKVRLSMPNKADCIEINLLSSMTTFIEKIL